MCLSKLKNSKLELELSPAGTWYYILKFRFLFQLGFVTGSSYVLLVLTSMGAVGALPDQARYQALATRQGCCNLPFRDWAYKCYGILRFLLRWQSGGNSWYHVRVKMLV